MALTAVPTGTTTTSLAPGFRFHPTDEELILYYLKRKVQNKPTRYEIDEIEIYKHEPWELAAKSKLKTRDEECYFFSAVDKKYSTGGRLNRQTSQGYWKITGRDREIIRVEDLSLIGMAKSLVFHQGRAPDGTRTNWVMHEYRLVQEDDETEHTEAPQQDTYVLCRVFEKNEIGPLKGNKYASFLEQEWEDDDARAKNKIQQENKSRIITFDDDYEPLKSKEDLHPSVLNKKPPLPTIQYKRKRQKSNNNSNQTTHHQDSSSSAYIANALLEFSLMGCCSHKNKTPVATTMLPLPHGSSFSSNKVIKENREIVLERETYKLDLMKAEMMVDMLQGRINALREENEELKKKIKSKDS